MKKILSIIVFIFSFLSSSVAFSQSCTGAGSLLKVRNTSIGIHEFVIFEVKKPPTLKPYTSSNANGPFVSDPSGLTVNVTGPKYRKIQFKNMNWTCSTNVIINPNVAVKDAKNVGQQEGQIRV